MRAFILGFCGLVLVSCVSTQSKWPREPSSDLSTLSLESPLTGLSFWEEFESAQEGRDDEDIKNPKYKSGVFYRWLKANPIGLFRDLRQKSPVLFLDRSTDLNRKQPSVERVVLSSSQDIEYVFKNKEQFSYVRPYDAYLVGDHANGMTPRMSQWVSRIFNRDSEKVRNLLRPLIDQAINQGIYIGKNEKGQIFARMEYVSQYGRKIPFLVNEKLYGISGFELKEATEISRGLADDLLMNPADESFIQERSEKVNEIIDLYVQGLIAGTIRAPQGTILYDLQNEIRSSESSKAPLSSLERKTLGRMIAGLFAGVETSQTTVAHVIDVLMRFGYLRQAQELAVSGQDESLRRLMYEALRFDPVVPYATRKAIKEVRLPSGETLAAGSILILGTQSAMFDENRVSDPYKFKSERSFKDFLHFRRSGMMQVRDQISEVETFEMLKALLVKKGLRRAEGHFGQIDQRRPVTKNLIRQDRFRYSFPERWDLEFDADALRAGVEVSDKEYPYEDYLLDYDRVAFRLCLGGLDKSLASTDDGGDSFWKNMKELGRILGQTRTIVGNIPVSRMNRTRENKHLLYCRMPTSYRKCVETKEFSILKAEDRNLHWSQYQSCRDQLTDLEKTFYENVFFQVVLDQKKLNATQANRPQKDYLIYEDYLKFYDRYRVRESMMNPAGYVMNDHQMLFYVRLNIDFRMCVGGPVLKNKYSGGVLGTSKAEQYEKCKSGQINPETFRREGELTALEQNFYEKIMLGK